MLIDLVTSELVAGANACDGAERLRELALEQLGRLAPFDSAVFLPRSPVDRPTLKNKPPGHGEIYRHFRLNWPSYERELGRAHAIMAIDGAYLDSEIYSLGERDGMSFFGDILRPQGITSRLVVQVAFRGHVAAVVNLCRHDRSPPFRGEHLELAQRIAPLLGLTCAAFETRRAADPLLLDGLSAAELRLVELLRGGYRNKEIARLLSLSPNTVRNQLARIFTKLRVKSRAELAALAERARLGR
jgi:DNA-binding CsgD family transcriptional regulator